MSYIEALKTETPEPPQERVAVQEFDSYGACLEKLQGLLPSSEAPQPLPPAHEKFLDEYECHFTDFFLEIRDAFSVFGFLDHPHSYVKFIQHVVMPNVVLVEDGPELLEDQFSGEE